MTPTPETAQVEPCRVSLACRTLALSGALASAVVAVAVQRSSTSPSEKNRAKSIAPNADAPIDLHVKRVVVDFIIKRVLLSVSPKEDPHHQARLKDLSAHPGLMLVPESLFPSRPTPKSASHEIYGLIRDFLRKADENDQVASSTDPDVIRFVEELFDLTDSIVDRYLRDLEHEILHCCSSCGCALNRNSLLGHLATLRHQNRLIAMPWTVSINALSAAFSRYVITAMSLAHRRQTEYRVLPCHEITSPRHRKTKIILSGWAYEDLCAGIDAMEYDLHFNEHMTVRAVVDIPTEWGETKGHFLSSVTFKDTISAPQALRFSPNPACPWRSTAVLELSVVAPSHPGRITHLCDVYLSHPDRNRSLIIVPFMFILNVHAPIVGDSWTLLQEVSLLPASAPPNLFREANLLRPEKSGGGSSEPDPSRALIRKTQFPLATLRHWEVGILPTLAKMLHSATERSLPEPEEEAKIRRLWREVDDLFPHQDGFTVLDHPLIEFLTKGTGREFRARYEMVRTLKFLSIYTLDARIIAEILFEVYEQEAQQLHSNRLTVEKFDLTGVCLTLTVAPSEISKHHITEASSIACYDGLGNIRHRFCATVNCIDRVQRTISCTIPVTIGNFFTNNPSKKPTVLHFIVMPDMTVVVSMLALWSLYRRSNDHLRSTAKSQVARNQVSRLLQGAANRILDRSSEPKFTLASEIVENESQGLQLFTSGGNRPISKNQLNFCLSVAPHINAFGHQLPPFSLHGPPGTGKSHTIASLLAWLAARDAELPAALIVTPTNQAAEQLMLKIHTAFSGNVLADSQGKILWAVRQDYEDDIVVVPAVLKHYVSPAPDFNSFFEARIVVCTADFLIKHILYKEMFYQSSKYMQYFRLLVFEEAAAITLCQGLLCCLVSDRATIIDAGDVHQLTPVLIGKQATKGGLTQSFMSVVAQVQGNNPHYSHYLTTNYRSLPELLHVSNTILYTNQKRMTSDATAAENLRRTLDLYEPSLIRKLFPLAPFFMATAILLHDIPRQLTGTRSYANLSEASAVICCVRVLLDAGVDPNQIGILAMYAAQVVLLKELLKSMDLLHMFCGTPNKSQGGERDFVIISCVRGTDSVDALISSCEPQYQIGKHGYVNLQRTNVAWTRARIGCIVIVDPASLVDQPFVSNYLNHVMSRGSYINLLSPCQVAALSTYLQPPLTNFTGICPAPYPAEDGFPPPTPRLVMETD